MEPPLGYEKRQKTARRNTGKSKRLRPQKLLCRRRPTDNEAITLIRNPQAMLATANLRLHKVVSNSVLLVEDFPAEDCAKNIKDLDRRRGCTTIATLSWGSVEHREGRFHLPCLAARKALHTERSSVCNKLGARPSWICIPSHPGRETRHHGGEGERQRSSWTIHFRRRRNTSGVDGETYSPSWKN